MKLSIILVIMMMTIGLIAADGHCGNCTGEHRTVIDSEKETFQRSDEHVIPRANRAHWITDDYYVTYEWDKRPRIGNHILIVKLYDRDKNLVQDLNVTADAYMPTMKGSHDTGDLPMQVNNRGNYAIPVFFMMLGDWEIELKFNQDDKEVARAYVQLAIR